ncbi:MAG: GatB/YqeY domain-containing protein, partial [Synergistota bacterium]|nr:GatB/YqeY domain-containing protein [Synergistota bacterium]
MTDLERRIHNDMVQAMKSRNAAVLDPLRMLKAALQNASVEKGRESELSEDEIITVVGRLVK